MEMKGATVTRNVPGKSKLRYIITVVLPAKPEGNIITDLTDTYK